MADAASTRPKIALTFDDGPSDATARIIDVLEETGSKATFYVLGERVAHHERELKRMAAGGLQIGNHTWSHKFIQEIPADELRRSISRTNDAIRAACGVVPTTLRPPGGTWCDASLAILREMGLPAVFWNVDPRDWATKDAQSTIDHVLEKAEDGRIVIMHDRYEQTANAAEVIVPALVSRGFDLLTVDELAQNRGGMEPGERYYGF